MCRKERDQELVVLKPRFWHKEQYKVFFACEKKFFLSSLLKNLELHVKIRQRGISPS